MEHRCVLKRGAYALLLYMEHRCTYMEQLANVAHDVLVIVSSMRTAGMDVWCLPAFSLKKKSLLIATICVLPTHDVIKASIKPLLHINILC